MNAAQFGPYYHGSNTEFEPGDELKPPSETGNSYWAQHYGDTSDKVYSVGTGQISTRNVQDSIKERGFDFGNMTSRPLAEQAERMAWTFATQRVSARPNRRSAVYKVKPVDPQMGDQADIPGEVYSPRATVRSRIDIMPGRQGTFPELNWNQFAKNLEARTEDAPFYVPWHEEDSSGEYVLMDHNHPPDPATSPVREDERRAGLVGREAWRPKNLEFQRRVMDEQDAREDKAQTRLF